MNTLAIIPARGGSKGIPRKNVQPLCGKPLIAWTIEAATVAARVDRVVVSTDDAEIAAVSERFGAQVVRRPVEISGGTASSESALLDVLEQLKKAEGYQPDLVVFLQCTSPLTAPEDIDGAIQTLLDEEADTALAVTDFHYFLWRVGDQGEAVGINHDQAVRQLRQQRKTQFLETGAVYVLRAPGFRKAKHRFFGKSVVHVMPRERCLEIDDPEDLEIAEALLLRRRRNERLRALPNSISALVLDFDGVFTDNRVLVAEDGREAVFCNRGDGMGLERIRKSGIPILVLSTERNPVVRARCDKLGLECIHDVRDKLAVLSRWITDNGVDAAEVVYVGNDINDVSCMRSVGCPIAVSDAYPQAKTVARIILANRGGHGAIREVTELIQARIGELPR